MKKYNYYSDKLSNDNEGGTVKSTSKVNSWLRFLFVVITELGSVTSTIGQFETYAVIRTLIFFCANHSLYGYYYFAFFHNV